MFLNNTPRSIDEITDNQERVTNLKKDIVYYAHLSSYNFAPQFSQDSVILDAGCGSG